LVNKIDEEWKRDKWKCINIEMKRCQYRKIITNLEATHAHSDSCEEIYNNKQQLGKIGRTDLMYHKMNGVTI